MSLAKQKAYESVLDKLKHFINDKQLQPGDKLPSEREFAEQLGVGRSSVREALRAIELLGLIETRQGEGTFLREYQSLSTVRVLSSFILQEQHTVEEVGDLRRLVEKEALKLAFKQTRQLVSEQWLQLFTEETTFDTDHHYLFFQVVFKNIEHPLLQKLWHFLMDFSHHTDFIQYNKEFYQDLIYIFKHNTIEIIEDLYEK
ncbi:HTH-type transcriptional repressor NanR [Paraliobacillus ryukyuensis]|uniref:GntR family transcriptional regulator n=1 Tax=Paraliobacillus ryukyuensis TaxID=200904 RepID=A0A366ECE0_9BACI|nr:GntR family transcriptional regulator [Paraliobacillus ryukyuensis]RBO99399.1 GntR family transcriptional regulator [Paraliobacillus ryukyuensis]